MEVEAVLVSLRVEGKEKTYTSGLLFNSNLVLITGTFLIPFVNQKKWISLLVQSSSSALQPNPYIHKVSFEVCVEDKIKTDSGFEGKTVWYFESTPVGVWKSSIVSESVENLFSDWTLGHVNFKNDSNVLSYDDIEVSKELMSVFILLQCKSTIDLEYAKKNNKFDDIVPGLLNLLLSLRKPNRGQEVEVVSTPFGSELFMNSLSRGIVSNTMGCQKCIILSDVRLVSGCEGGPIFLSRRSRKDLNRVVLGIVLCPLTWWRGEWVGFTIGVSLLPVLKRLLETIYPTNYVKSLHSLRSDIVPVSFIDETVVLVRSIASWGTGVVVNCASGLIITCSHVVNDDEVVTVFQNGNNYVADVLFKSEDDLAYDLAIIKLRNYVLKKEASLSKNIVKVGETVLAAGFPFFSERDDEYVRPSIAFGCVARVNPYMIQTTCCIQSGFSGGALFRGKELIGIIICNMRDSVTGAVFPHINFVLPSTVFREPVLNYIKTRDVECLNELNCGDSRVQAIWKLQETSKL